MTREIVNPIKQIRKRKQSARTQEKTTDKHEESYISYRI